MPQPGIGGCGRLGAKAAQGQKPKSAETPRNFIQSCFFFPSFFFLGGGVKTFRV